MGVVEKQYTEIMRVDLEPAEWLEYGKRLALLCQGIEAKEAEERERRNAVAEGKKADEKERSALAKTVQRGWEERKVTTEERRDQSTGIVSVVRLDTGEIIREIGPSPDHLLSGVIESTPYTATL